MPPAQLLRADRRACLSPAAHVLCALAAAALVQSAPASAQKVRITNLSDVDFGTITNLQADSRRAQNICLYSNGTAGGYSVLASGSGSGSAFSLANGPSLLGYEVEWSGQSGQSSGTALSPNIPLTGQTSSATHQFCNSGPSASASLVVVLRGSQLSRARQGNYSGTLTLLIAAE
jgi:hypothetical protein